MPGLTLTRPTTRTSPSFSTPGAIVPARYRSTSVPTMVRIVASFLPRSACDMPAAFMMAASTFVPGSGGAPAYTAAPTKSKSEPCSMPWYIVSAELQVRRFALAAINSWYTFLAVVVR